MRRTGSVILPFVVAVIGVVLFSGYRISGDLQARSDGNSIVVSWSMADESDVQYYEVLRKHGLQGEFEVIAQIQKKGSNSTYEYRDLSVFKIEDGLYYYKIRIVTGGYPIPETPAAAVSFVSSAPRRTWGSIKAMFR